MSVEEAPNRPDGMGVGAGWRLPDESTVNRGVFGNVEQFILVRLPRDSVETIPQTVRVSIAPGGSGSREEFGRLTRPASESLHADIVDDQLHKNGEFEGVVHRIVARNVQHLLRAGNGIRKSISTSERPAQA